jgi:uncharacterized delta-60 repeat protein
MLVSVAIVPAAFGAPGDLDRSFGTAGQRVVENVFSGIGEDNTGLHDLRLLPDGSMVVLGGQRCGMDCVAQMVARYTPAGDPDPTFGPPDQPGAMGFRGYYGYDDGAHSIGLAVHTDGRLVFGYAGGSEAPRLEEVPADGLSAHTVTPASEPVGPVIALADGRVVARTAHRRIIVLGSDLTPDPAFHGGRGVAIPAALRTIGDITADRQAIYVVGKDDRNVVLVRFPLDGGKTSATRVRIPQPASGPRFRVGSAKVTVSGRRVLVSAGVDRYSRSISELRTALVAFRTTGGVDTGFGRAGVVFVSQALVKVALQPNGKVVLASGVNLAPRTATTPDFRLLVRRLNADGRPDRSFRTAPVKTVANSFYGMDVDLDAKGRIVVAAAPFATYPSKGVLFVRFIGGEGRAAS